MIANAAIIAGLLLGSDAGVIERPVVEDRPPVTTPVEVVEAPDTLTIFEDGSWRADDGSTGCVFAAPCWVSDVEIPEIELIDPVWAELEGDDG